MVSKTSNKKIKVAEKRIRALELRKAGKSFQEIADILQCAKSTAHGLVSTALKSLVSRVEEHTAELQELENQRLDCIWEQQFKKALKGDPVAANICLKISERRAKLNSLDGTQKVEHSGGITISLQMKDCSKREDACDTTPATQNSSIRLLDQKE